MLEIADMKTLLMLSLLLLGAPLNAQKLTMRDQALRATSTALIFADWSMTMDGLSKGLPESNPLLGKHPSRGYANTLIGSTLLLNVFAVPHLHADDLRAFVWLAVIAIELDAVRANHSAGLSLSLRF